MYTFKGVVMDFLPYVLIWLMCGLAFGIAALGTHHTKDNPLLCKMFREKDLIRLDAQIGIFLILLPPAGFILTVYRFYALFVKPKLKKS